ncbi:MAG: phosphoribosylanthranilate isomerase [Candidatus Acidiferrales bacterium]|jgi:phosphoribosylanthranilate isomerase|nr:phosphoribosylanthranilate isomerase [Candidatus Acidoferrales bacterium]
MRIRVKICGITNWKDAEIAIDAGADALGFNFYAKSPRRIAVSHAKEIIDHMPSHVTAVGVFVNGSARAVLRIARTTNLGMLQLHGEESPAAVERLAREYPVIKAFRVGPRFRVSELKRYASAAGFLLDGYDVKRRGGTGKRFDWNVARDAKRYGSVILAGGLRAESVADAIRQVKPFGLDVCSGVETRAGKKDAKKVQKLMAAVRRVGQ